MVRSERRRREKELKTADMQCQNHDSKKDYETIAPILDESVNSLKDFYRSAILLRFYEEHNYQDIGKMTESSEDASRMRVKRALIKLQTLLTKRGVSLSLTALSTSLSSHVIQAVPVTLGATLASKALSKAATQTGILNQIQAMFQLTQIKAGVASAIVSAAVVTPVTIKFRKKTV